MKKLIFALLLLPTLAIAQTQTQDLPCPGSVTVTFVGGYTITTTCSMGGVVPPPPPPTVCSGSLPAGTVPSSLGYVFAGGDSSRIVAQADGCLAIGSLSAGWKLAQLLRGDIFYCVTNVNNPTCYFKAG